ncbi:MAG TPA: hypothetical protein VH142_03065 [Polyangiaceae bacterium]|nr:hypothetical protein [Polyangiaceae bacterium]
MRFDTVLLTSAVLAAFPAIARADTSNPDTSPKQERRSGLLVGVTPLFSSGTAFGYPNQAAQIGDPAYFANGGAMAGGGVNGYVMAALADVFNFGLYFGYTFVANNDWHSEGIGGGFRLEAFPLYSLVPSLKDLGLFAQFGIGSANLEATRGAYPGSDGVQSYVSAGVFYEFTIAHLRKHGHLTLAPSLEYDYVGARSIDRHTAGLGLRVAFYSGP